MFCIMLLKCASQEFFWAEMQGFYILRKNPAAPVTQCKSRDDRIHVFHSKAALNRKPENLPMKKNTIDDCYS